MPKPRDFAKTLRKNTTLAEKRLWFFLRANRLKEYKFRRQAPIGPYIVDFVCLEKKLIIECDGGQHDIRRPQGAIRDDWLREKGYRVMRYWNNQVLGSTDVVMQEIFKALELGGDPSP